MLSNEAVFPQPGSWARVPSRNMRRVRIIRANADGTVFVTGDGENRVIDGERRILHRAAIALTLHPDELRPDDLTSEQRAPRARARRRTGEPS